MTLISKLTNIFGKKKPQPVPFVAPVVSIIPVAPVAPKPAPIAAPPPTPAVVSATPTLVTVAHLRQIFSTPQATLELFVGPINKYCNENGINTRNRLAMFLAQVGHESGGFTALKENLNYSSAALLRVFPKYFPTAALADQYAKKPKAIGSRVYANRMGNGNEASGDGFKHRGFGAIQLTGKQNQTKFAAWAKMSLDEAIVYLQTPEGAILGAIWFWEVNGLNALSDKGEAGVTPVTKRINGGTNGLTDRLTKFKKAYTILDQLP